MYPPEEAMIPGFFPKGVREVQHHSDGAHFFFMWLKQCILIATRISKSFNVVFHWEEPGYIVHCYICDYKAIIQSVTTV